MNQVLLSYGHEHIRLGEQTALCAPVHCFQHRGWNCVTFEQALAQSSPSTAILRRSRHTIGLIHLSAASRSDTRRIRESRESFDRPLSVPQSPPTGPAKILTVSAIRRAIACSGLFAQTNSSDFTSSN